MKNKIMMMLVGSLLVGSLTVTGCGKKDAANDQSAETEVTSEATVEEVKNAEENKTEEKAEDASKELVTYDFETYDGRTVVLDASNIVTQETSETPEESELISAEAAGNVIAPGKDLVYLEDDNNFYVADYSRNLVTVAKKEAAAEEKTEASLDNPGFFENDNWSISYDTEKWNGHSNDDGSVIINNLNAAAGSSYIELYELDCEKVDDAVKMLEESKGKKLTTPSSFDMNEKATYSTYDAETPETELYIFDYYLLFEHNGKVIVLDEAITHDEDDARAEALSYEFDDVVKTLELK